MPCLKWGTPVQHQPYTSLPHPRPLDASMDNVLDSSQNGMFCICEENKIMDVECAKAKTVMFQAGVETVDTRKADSRSPGGDHFVPFEGKRSSQLCNLSLGVIECKWGPHTRTHSTERTETTERDGALPNTDRSPFKNKVHCIPLPPSVSQSM